MRLCVIGNSHVGMLRAAARELGADRPEITFFSKAGSGLEKAVIQGSVIAATDQGLQEAQARFAMPAEIDVSTFDAVILVAGTASVYSALRLLQSHRVSGWDSCRGPGTRPGLKLMDRALVSEPAFIATLTDTARAGLSFRFAAAFRRASAVPIFLVPQPFPSELVFDSKRPKDFGFLRARKNRDGAAISACLTRAIDAAFAEIDRVTVLHQAAETVAHGFTTARAFTRDAVRIDGNTPQQETDLLHVGSAFGRGILARVAAGLDQAETTGSADCAKRPSGARSK